MADTGKIKQALGSYTGDNETLNQFVSVATAELGENWTSTIFETLSDLTPDEQNRLDYAFRHYAAMAAWNEAQSYLSGNASLSRAELDERIPVLEHWLEFYQDPGKQVVDQLKQLASTLSDSPTQPASTAAAPVSSATAQDETPAQTPVTEQATPENNKALWMVEKIRREVEITKELQAWVAARCVDLGNKEVMHYPYYGLVIDVMRQTRKQIQSLMESPDMLDEIARAYPDEIKTLQDYQLLLDKDIEVATQNGLDQDLDLLGNLSVEDVKRILGQLDTSTEKEESEPAPDGFVPILDSDSDSDEQPIKEEYSQIENVVLSEVSDQAPDDTTKNSETDEKNTSQTQQNSVKKKLSFSLGNKKPAGT